MKKHRIYALWLIFLFVFTITLTIGLAGAVVAGNDHCCTYRAEPDCPWDYGHYDILLGTCICAQRDDTLCYHYCSGCGIPHE